MDSATRQKFATGLASLAQPILPLVRMVQLLFLATPLENIEQLCAELTEPIETEGITYPAPRDQLQPYLPALRELEILKQGGEFARLMVDEQRQPVELFAALDAWLHQAIISRELETINSQLCGPCRCDLCCVGPTDAMAQEFFEIPLAAPEVALFALPRTDSDQSRSTTPYQEPPLTSTGAPFYHGEAAIYHWQSGWSMILPRNARCPQLTPEGSCAIYPQRPEVCRRPQIFCYVIEPYPELDRRNAQGVRPAYMMRHKLLAVRDCPYVQALQEEIATYAGHCGLELIVKTNKQ